MMVRTFESVSERHEARHVSHHATHTDTPSTPRLNRRRPSCDQKTRLRAIPWILEPVDFVERKDIQGWEHGTQ